jgi:uncharacterized protein YceH (UPF0502 family)
MKRHLSDPESIPVSSDAVILELMQRIEKLEHDVVELSARIETQRSMRTIFGVEI